MTKATFLTLIFANNFVLKCLAKVRAPTFLIWNGIHATDSVSLSHRRKSKRTKFTLIYLLTKKEKLYPNTPSSIEPNGPDMGSHIYSTGWYDKWMYFPVQSPVKQSLLKNIISTVHKNPYFRFSISQSGATLFHENRDQMQRGRGQGEEIAGTSKDRYRCRRISQH